MTLVFLHLQTKPLHGLNVAINLELLLSKADRSLVLSAFLGYSQSFLIPEVCDSVMLICPLLYLEINSLQCKFSHVPHTQETVGSEELIVATGLE